MATKQDEAARRALAGLPKAPVGDITIATARAAGTPAMPATPATAAPPASLAAAPNALTAAPTPAPVAAANATAPAAASFPPRPVVTVSPAGVAAVETAPGRALATMPQPGTALATTRPAPGTGMAVVPQAPPPVERFTPEQMRAARAMTDARMAPLPGAAPPTAGVPPAGAVPPTAAAAAGAEAGAGRILAGGLRGAINRAGAFMLNRAPAINTVLSGAQTLTDPRMIEAGSSGTGNAVQDVGEAATRALLTGATFGLAGSPIEQRATQAGNSATQAEALKLLDPEQRRQYDLAVQASYSGASERPLPDPRLFLTAEQRAQTETAGAQGTAAERARQTKALERERDTGGTFAGNVLGVLNSLPFVNANPAEIGADARARAKDNPTTASGNPQGTLATAPTTPVSPQSARNDAALNSTAPGTAYFRGSNTMRDGKTLTPKEIEDAANRLNVIPAAAFSAPPTGTAGDRLRYSSEVDAAAARNANTRARIAEGNPNARDANAEKRNKTIDQLTEQAMDAVRGGKRRSARALTDLLGNYAGATAVARSGTPAGRERTPAEEALSLAQAGKAQTDAETSRIAAQQAATEQGLRERFLTGTPEEKAEAATALATLSGKTPAQKIVNLKVPVGEGVNASEIEIPYDPATGNIVAPPEMMQYYTSLLTQAQKPPK